MALTYLYAIRLPVNDYAIAYVGVTKNIKRRFWHHIAPSNKSSLGAAMRACGRSNVIMEILEIGPRDLIYAREIESIVKFNTRWPSGYNISAGGYGSRDPLPSTRQKISVAASNISADTRMRRSQSLKLAFATPEYRAKKKALHESLDYRTKIAKQSTKMWQSTSQRKKIIAAMKYTLATPSARTKKSAAMKLIRGTVEARAKTSEISKQAWAQPGAREKRALAIQAANARPDVRSKRSLASKIANARPGVREKRKASITKYWTSETRAAHSAKMKEILRIHPEIQTKRQASLRKTNACPEVRARRSAALKAAYKRPEVKAALKEARARPTYREKMSTSQKARWTPETRAKHALIAITNWTNPEFRAKHKAASTSLEANAKRAATRQARRLLP